MNKEVLNIAAKFNYWKPYQFFFRYFQLIQYFKYDNTLNGPILELGSGDGTFTRMLFELKKIKGNHISTDFSINDLRTAQNHRSGNYSRLDVCNLPYKNNSMSTVLSNGVICCLMSKLDSDVDAVISESYRVLKPDGKFIMSVATNNFNENLSTYKFLKRLGLKETAKRYINSFEERLTHFIVYSEDQWIEKLKNSGFKIEKIGYFFTPNQGFWYGLLSLKIFNLISAIKLLNIGFIKKLSANLLKFASKPIINKENKIIHDNSKSGYIVIFASK